VRRPAGEPVVAFLALAVAAVSASQLIGHPARLVDVLTLFASGFAAGMALARVIDRVRARRRSQPATGRPPP
jgi:hypothetical protein